MPKIQVVATSDMMPTIESQRSRTNHFADHTNLPEYSNVVDSKHNRKDKNDCRNYFKFSHNQKDCSELSACPIKDWLEKQISDSAKHEGPSTKIVGLFDLLQASENDFPSRKKEKTKTVFKTNQF